MKASISGRTLVAGVVGAPVAHSLSPLLHNAWLKASGIDGVYVAFAPAPERFADFVRSLRGGAIRGLNVTLPFKLEALALADVRTARAEASGAANLLRFEADGSIWADNTDGEGLLAAFAEQAPGFDPAAGPVAILGAGGAARGAAAAFLDAGCLEIRVINRTPDRAHDLRSALGPRITVVAPGSVDAYRGVTAIINARSLGLGGGEGPSAGMDRLSSTTVVMDMVYRPLETDFLRSAKARGLRVVDGLAMLIAQARPSFESLFGAPPPAEVNVRALALAALENDG